MTRGWVARFKIVAHVMLGLLLGGCIAMVYVTSSPRFRTYVQQSIESACLRDFGVQLKCQVDSIDWLSLQVHLSNMQIGHSATLDDQNSDATWSIVAERVTVQSSWLSLLVQRALVLHVQFGHVIMMERFAQSPDNLKNFCVQMFTQAGSPWVRLEAISITDGLLHLKRMSDGLYVDVPHHTTIELDARSTKLNMRVHDGVLWYQQGMSIDHVGGTLTVEFPYASQQSSMRVDTQFTGSVHHHDVTTQASMTGHLRDGRGYGAITTDDESIVIDPITVKLEPQHCWCFLKVRATPQLLHHFNVPDVLTDLGGHVGVEVQFDAYNIVSTLQFSVLLSDLLYKAKPMLPGATFTITHHTKQSCSGFFCMNNQQWARAQFELVSGGQTLTMHSCKTIELVQGWVLPEQQCSAEIRRNKQGLIQGNYQAMLQHSITGQTMMLQGTLVIKDQVLVLQGMIDGTSYNLELQLAPELMLKSFQMFDGSKLVVDVAADQQDSAYIVGSVDFALLKKIVPEPFKMSFAQDGSFTGRGYFKDGVLHTALQTHYAHIRIPYVYNVIQNMTVACEIDMQQRSIVLKDVAVDLHEGTMRCLRATALFDSSLNCVSLHVPIMFDHIMMSVYKGVYGLASGRILMTKHDKDVPTHVEGKLFLHKVEVKENILSTQFHEIVAQFAESSSTSLWPEDVTFDIGVMVHDGLQVSTSFMSARAMVELMVQGCLKQPKISGSINIVEGQLHFPYKSLSIVQGKVLLLPEQLLDPVIQLTAKGKIKRYLVTLQAHGTALAPHIQFESQPYLDENQILSLLMLGVEDQSLSLMVPAFLTQKFQEIMFGPALSTSKLKAVFDGLWKTMKYVRFLPQFTNQADRGGLRGIFEIDASEDLHGKIDTNFEKIEDTKFDVDYDVTDDVTLRLQKDGPSTYGGEVEFRWKFS
ncbi:translocation/assembly module TamB domain-containing protein [Candidatus Babeliales bacterium]|nr:translocation/assembly module TamB domain-containing protein [Candidatus Babeliales bacterium]